MSKIPLANEHLFFNYFVRLSLGNTIGSLDLKQGQDHLSSAFLLHHRWLPCQILGSNTAKKVQIGPQTIEI